MLVAGQTGELVEIRRDGMAIAAGRPLPSVHAGVDGKEGTIVIESRPLPGGSGVARGAIGGEAGRLMARTVGVVVISLMTANTLRALAGVHSVAVALVAAGRTMRPGQRELSPTVVVEGGGPRGGRVALHAVGTKGNLTVAGLRGLIVRLLVTAHALRWHAPEAIPHVALVTGDRPVCAGYRKPAGIVVEPSPVPGHGAVALCALRRKPTSHVIGVRGGLIIGPVARDAVSGNCEEGELTLRCRDVTTATVGNQMGAVEREPGQLVIPGHRGPVDKAPGRMTLGAIGPQFTPVEIGVARDAVRRCVAEVEGLMTGSTGRLGVCTAQREAMAGVIERLTDLDRRPTLGSMADGTLLF